MITTVVFDMGNVLLTYRPREFLSACWEDEGICDRLYHLIFCSEEWGKLDRGLLTFREAEEIFCRREPDLEKQIRYVMNNWDKLIAPIEPTLALARKLKEQGLRLCYLSNYSGEGVAYIRRTYAFWDLFDGGVFSYEVHINKPDRGIYQALLERCGLKAAECVFLDDMPENIAVAKELGMQGIVFEDAQSCETQLKELCACALS